MSWADGSNMKYMYTSACGYIVDCIEFIWGIYTDTIVSYLHVILLAYEVLKWMSEACLALPHVWQ